MTTPSWFQHPDLMNLLIGFLILVVGWFIRREFVKFDVKLDSACKGVSSKVDKESFKEFKETVYYQLHEHDHQIECDVDNCKPKTAGVIIRERRHA